MKVSKKGFASLGEKKGLLKKEALAGSKDVQIFRY